jgi:hypothetical protein
MSRTKILFVALATGLVVGATTLKAQPTSEKGEIWMTVTAVGRHGSTPPAISRDQVTLYEGRSQLKVLGWKREPNLGLAIVIDDSLDTAVGTQLKDLRDFIKSLPETTQVAIAYTSNGRVTMAQDFTADHGLAEKAVRLPRETLDAFASPYLSLTDLMKRWTSSESRRAILLISDGIDYIRGTYGPLNPDLLSTIEMAQNKDVVIYTLYAQGVGHASRLRFHVLHAQDNLNMLADETGGEAFFQGFAAPVSFKPFLEQIGKYLNQQYLVAFRPMAGPQQRRQRVRVHTEVPGVEFLAPSVIYVEPQESTSD